MENLNMLKYIIKKLWIIILVGIICAGGLVIEKNFFVNTVSQSGEIALGYNLKIQNYVNQTDPFRYDFYMTTDTTIFDFLKKTDGDIEYNKLDQTWDKKTELDKCEWVRKHIFIKYYGSGQYEIYFRINANEAKNFQYIKSNGNKFLEHYILYMETINQNVSIAVTNQFEYFQNKENISKQYVILKYACIGFVLGVIASTLVISLWSLRRKYV